ncbi:alkaline phosphatase PhoX [Desulfogranum mediterraneum]|uniref:alkaline phosphatase PhoX n=1 Tax=Desulfogranum mediterraneum TaxID=160661 RepID=UPI000407382A|nr:alkaline phosphatase PhoX [Desulfogranum mediterraneum]
MRKTLSVLALATGSCCILAASAAAADNRLLSLNDPMAAFLETRAYAKKMGASAEFRKMEGVAYDKKNNKIYIAMSSIDKTMSDDKGDITLAANKCGIVYEAQLDDNYNISSLKPAVVGGPYDKSVGSKVSSGFRDRCAVNNIANPDGLFADRHGNLWISEDTKNHTNNALWRWNGRKLERFATVPTGAEITGIIVTNSDDVLFNVQHPSAMSRFPYNRGTVGIVNGFKAGEAFKAVAVPSGDQVFDLQLASGSYQVLERVGEGIPNEVAGGRFGQVNRLDGSLKEICNHPDGNMFVPISASGDEAYLFTNYECRPGAIAKVYMKRNGKSWEILDGENLSFAGVQGTWNNCNASVTPWNTGLSSEEYEPVAAKSGWQKNVAAMSDYLGAQANPYDYGYPLELIPDPKGDSPMTTVVKHYAMGRLSYEMSAVMNDGKTVYSGDDGTGVVLAKFVADKAGDLSAGTLYAAKVSQQADDSFALKWIELGRSNSGDIYDAIRSVPLER